MVDLILPLFLEVDIAVCLEDELVKLLDVRVLSRHAVVVREGEGGLVVPVDDVHGSQGGGLDGKDGGGDQTLNWHCWDGEEILVRSSGVTNLLRDTLADPYGDSLVLEPGLFVQLKRRFSLLTQSSFPEKKIIIVMAINSCNSQYFS